MKVVIADTEGDNLTGLSSKLWIVGGKELDTGEIKRFEPFRGKSEVEKVIEWASTVDLWVFHNGLAHDLPELHTYIKPRLIDPKKVIDTLVVSRLIHYGRPGNKPHSLDSWGARLGKPKGKFSDFSKYSKEMVEYWEQDIATGEALYLHLKPYIDDPSWVKSIRVEHDVQIELIRQQYYGFHFNRDKAKTLLSHIKDEMEKLEYEIHKDYPPKMEHVHTIKYRLNKDGTENAVVAKTKSRFPITKVDGEELLCYNYVSFNPGSPIQRIDKLWEAGWKPFEKTKTYQLFLRKRVGEMHGKVKITQEFYDQKLSHFKKYGWVVNEDNLNTLPKTAPAGARKLAQWLTLEGRRSSLVEWLAQCKDDSRIHGTTIHIGAWTGRAAHKSPNTANIASAWPEGKEPKTPVEVVKARYDTDLRSLWCVPKGSWLVGVDADGIQLRILADYLWKHYGKDDYAKAILAGRKEDGTDIHNVNRKALSLEHVTRDMSKTFIYAWVLNAGDAKVASILQTKKTIAKEAKVNFENSIPGLKPFKTEFLPEVARLKYFTGYDGRKVIVPSLHKALAGILQNGEAVLMKHAMVKLHKEIKPTGIRAKQLAFVHDELQNEVIGEREEAEHVLKLGKESIAWAGKELGFLIDIAGSGGIGTNWSNTH